MKKPTVAVATLGLIALTSAVTLNTSFAGHHRSSEREKNIVQIARTAGSFNTLVTALEAAGLVGTLSGQGHGEFTVFAPTDEAFAKLPAGTVESLLGDREALRAILLYHVVAGELDAEHVVAQQSLETVNGQSLTVSVTSGGVMVNNAKVLTPDIGARNGVIHVIDTVLLPN